MTRVKKFVFPFLIVCIAGAVSWWSSHQESSIRNHVQKEVSRLIPRFHADPTLVHSIVVDPILEKTLANSLEFVYANSLQHDIEYVVVVTRGDNMEYGDGLATHVATIQIDEQPIAGYRVICNSDRAPLQIAGVIPGVVSR